MKKLIAVFAVVFALALFVGCAEEPVEEEMATDDTEQAMEAPADTGGEEMMEDTAMSDTTMEEGEGMMEEGEGMMEEGEGEMMEGEGDAAPEGDGN